MRGTCTHRLWLIRTVSPTWFWGDQVIVRISCNEWRCWRLIEGCHYIHLFWADHWIDVCTLLKADVLQPRGCWICATGEGRDPRRTLLVLLNICAGTVLSISKFFVKIALPSLVLCSKTWHLIALGIDTMWLDRQGVSITRKVWALGLIILKFNWIDMNWIRGVGVGGYLV